MFHTIGYISEGLIIHAANISSYMYLSIYIFVPRISHPLPPPPPTPYSYFPRHVPYMHIIHIALPLMGMSNQYSVVPITAVLTSVVSDSSCISSLICNAFCLCTYKISVYMCVLMTLHPLMVLCIMMSLIV